MLRQYLEERYPEPAIYPADLADRAQARWLEEFADSRMGEVFIWGLFNQVAINPNVWGKPPDPEVLERVRSTDIPHVLDYLETEAPETGFRFEQKSARTPIPKQREALAEIGAPISAESYGTAEPRRGMMRI